MPEVVQRREPPRSRRDYDLSSPRREVLGVSCTPLSLVPELPRPQTYGSRWLPKESTDLSSHPPSGAGLFRYWLAPALPQNPHTNAGPVFLVPLSLWSSVILPTRRAQVQKTTQPPFL